MAAQVNMHKLKNNINTWSYRSNTKEKNQCRTSTHGGRICTICRLV